MSPRTPAWFRIVTQAAARIRASYGIPDRNTEDRIVRVFRAALRPRKQSGRKPNLTTARAARLLADGLAAYRRSSRSGFLRSFERQLWQQIYREVLPDFESLDKLTRQYRTGTLRRNVKAYLKRQRAQSVTPDYRHRKNTSRVNV